MTISATVFGGIPPIPIKVYIDNLDNDHDIHFSIQGSFSKTIDLPPGKYSIMVGGMNPTDGYTDVGITGDFSEGPLPKSKGRYKSNIYSALFYVKVGL